MPALPPPPPPAIVRTVDCDTVARTADYEGDMRTINGASRLQMRFTVQYQAPGPDDSWQRVQAPNLDQWVTSQAGRSRYVYAKHLEGLQPGVGYRVVVKFRWKAADGTVLRSTTRRSRTCRVPDARPNLVPVSIERVTDGYVLMVANRGRSAAPASWASLDVGEAVLGDEPVPALAPGDRFGVTFSGPPCAAGEVLAGMVDATGLIDEAVEADDVLRVPCNG